MIVSLLGATASGKSALAIALAKHFPMSIVNADPFQTYRGMDILSAAPGEEEKKEVPHLLYGFHDPDVAYDIAAYQLDARKAIREVQVAGRVPLLVGGSGLYMRAATFTYELPKAKEAVDMAPYSGLSDGDLHGVLEKLDPEEAQKIHQNNRVRVLRAIELILSTGEKKSDLFAKKPEPIEPTLFLWLRLPREIIYERIDRRVDKMAASGLVEEVRSLVGRYGYGAPGLKAIGAKELFPYLKGELTLEECLLNLKKATRHYVKRQETFFLHQFPYAEVHNEDEAYERVCSFLSR